MVNLAIKTMLGRTLRELGYKGGLWKKQKLVGVKAPVFSMSKLAGVDTYLGPEMKSTGEVMGIDHKFGPALAKALMASGLMLPKRGTILLSISDRDKPEAVDMLIRGPNRGCPQGWKQWKIMKINKLHNFLDLLDFALYGSWEVLDRCKILVQGPLRISTPGRLHSENFFFRLFRSKPP